MRLIDISHALDNETPIFPGDYKTKLSMCKTIEKDYYNAVLLQSCLHTGTHIDMPMHLINDDKAAKDFSPDSFFGKGILLDVRGENIIEMKPIYNQIISEQDIVLLYTGFDEKYFTEEYFTHHPTISDDLARFLLSKKIKILGMDMPSPDYTPFKLHKELLQNGIFVLENLTNLNKLINIKKFDVMALPLKIDAEASFVRAVCLVDKMHYESTYKQ